MSIWQVLTFVRAETEEQRAALREGGYEILGEPEGPFVCVEDLDPRDGDSSDPLAPITQPSLLSERYGEAFSVSAMTIISEFRYDHWIDGARTRWIEQRSGQAARVQGAPEPWENDVFYDGRVLVESAFMVVLDHFGACPPGEEGLFVENLRDVHRKELPKALEVLAQGKARLERARTEDEVSATTGAATELRRTLDSYEHAKDLAALPGLDEAMEAVYRAEIAAWARVGRPERGRDAKAGLFRHYARARRNLHEALAMATDLAATTTEEDASPWERFHDLAMVHVARGELEEAFTAMQRGIDHAGPDERAPALDTAVELAHAAGDLDREIGWLQDLVAWAQLHDRAWLRDAEEDLAAALQERDAG